VEEISEQDRRVGVAMECVDLEMGVLVLHAWCWSLISANSLLGGSLTKKALHAEKETQGGTTVEENQRNPFLEVMVIVVLPMVLNV